MKIAYVHPDAEGREEEVAQNRYPRNQLWGADLLKEQGHDVYTIKTRSQHWTTWLGRLLNKLTKNRLCDFHIEFQILRQSKNTDLIYAPSGHLFIIPLLRRLGFLKPKLVTWFFRLPKSSSWWKLRNLRFSRYVLNGFDGILCLTKQAESDFQQRTNDVLVKYQAWFADPEIFMKDKERPPQDTGYFLSVGKTRRDYITLLKACEKVNATFRIIAPRATAHESYIPQNVQFIETSQNPPDAAISYPELRDWYANARAVVIPLIFDANDTSGYTNLLEAMAMGKPILMTYSGCLDIDVEKIGVGYIIPPENPEAWVKAIEDLLKNPERAKAMGDRGLEASQNQFSQEAFGTALNQFAQAV
ncbi:MAG: glycosyltransferase family 4 protein [Opitutae bacterium]|nr:glycosyltransferase family 4 protein [Opitutae bacterium]